MRTRALDLVIAVAFFPTSFLSAQQTKASSTNPITLVPVTLSMKWTRGNPHYGPDFIALAAPCRVNLEANCECTLNFKSTKSAEFADYVESFGEDLVPVVFQVLYETEPEAKTAKLETVGNWRAEKFRTNDRLLGISWHFKRSEPGTKPGVRIHQPADCFPLRTE